MRSTFLPASFSLLAILLMAGCSKDQITDPAQATITWKRPGTGSTFTYDIWEVDSNGAEIDRSRGTYGDTVLASDTTMYGTAGLLMLRNGMFADLLVHYRPSGDIGIAIFDDYPTAYPFTIYPVATRTPITRAPWSAVTGFGTVSMPGAVLSYLGSEQMTTPAGTFQTHRMLEVRSDSTFDGIPYTTSDTIWFAPAIGTYVKQSIQAVPVRQRDGVFAVLKSYQIK